MNALAAAVLAAGELICEIPDQPTREAILIYDVRPGEQAGVIGSRRAGRRPVLVREADGMLHLIEEDGPSVRVTTLTSCARSKRRGGVDTCTRFTAQHAWHFDPYVRLSPAAALQRQPAGAATGYCEAWRIE
jgi:hypothetical protein